MSRLQVLLAVLAAVLVVVLFYFLMVQPRQDEILAIEEDIDVQLELQRELTAERNRLRSVRERAPEVEADLVTAAAVLPPAPEVPEFLRQLDLAAEDSGVLLRSVAPQRPQQVADAEEGLSELPFTVQVEGTYFQIVDFLRRIETPTLSPRGVMWDDLSVAYLDGQDDEDIELGESPPLAAVVSGRVFALLPQPPSEEDPTQPVEPDDTDQLDEDGGPTEDTADVEVDVDATVEDEG